jgi:hypothetical protein
MTMPANIAIQMTRRPFAGLPSRCTGLESPIRAVQTHSCLDPHQTPPRHPQVRQREQRDDLRRVLGQAPVAHLGEAELLLDHTERVLDLGPDAGLHLLHPLGLELRLDERIEQPAPAWAHPEVPLLALAGLVHLRVAFAFGVLGRAGCGDQRGVHRRAGAQQQAFGLQDAR